MEALNQLVTDSLARYGLDRPVDPRRLEWSRWFACDSPHNLLVVPSKPGIFAIAEEVAANVARAPSPATLTDADVLASAQVLGGAALPQNHAVPARKSALAAESIPRRMLAVLRFAEDDDMAFVLDRMFTRVNPMRARLSAGGCFVRFVVIQEGEQRRNICNALNQWMRSSEERTAGRTADHLTSLELGFAKRTVQTPFSASETAVHAIRTGSLESEAKGSVLNLVSTIAFSHLDSGAAAGNLHCPQPLPSGF